MPRAAGSAHHEGDGTILGHDGHGRSPAGVGDDCPACRAYVAELEHVVRQRTRGRAIGETAASASPAPE